VVDRSTLEASLYPKFDRVFGREQKRHKMSRTGSYALEAAHNPYQEMVLKLADQ
jgi:hypothetical protein